MRKPPPSEARGLGVNALDKHGARVLVLPTHGGPYMRSARKKDKPVSQAGRLDQLKKVNERKIKPFRESMAFRPRPDGSLEPWHQPLKQTGFVNGVLRCRCGAEINEENMHRAGSGIMCAECSSEAHRLRYLLKTRGYWWLSHNIRGLIRRVK